LNVSVRRDLTVLSHEAKRNHRRPAHLGLFLLIMIQLFTFIAAKRATAQSTDGTILGTVKDPASSVIPSATVVLINKGTSAQRTQPTDSTGSYSFNNVEAGTYELTIEANGFSKAEFIDLDLQARETKRVDAQLTVANANQSVIVEGVGGAVVNTDISNIAQTKTGRELVDLPVAITSRSTGSTSPMTTLTTEPGVQTDTSGNISVAGIKPSMLSMSIDGLSSMGPRAAGPLSELFPSFNAISEIRVSEVNNAAEYGGISDITTTSKSGTNAYHGGAFENWQNDIITAKNPFSSKKPTLNMNNFGFFGGGPVTIPHLYSGHDRTFFFFSFEALRLPFQTVVVESVPSLALRSGNLSAYSSQIYNPNTGAAYAGNIIPAGDITTLSTKALQYLFPLPNTGSANAVSNNYTENFPTPISSNQEDARIDQTINSKQSFFVRGNYKSRSVEVAPTPGGTITGSALLGSFSQPEIDYGLTVAHNFIISTNLLNEVRAGFDGNHTWTTFNLPANVIAADLGLTNVSIPSGDAVPNFNISGFQPTGGNASTLSSNNTTQVIDNLTWTKQRHTLKFGGDYRRLRGNAANVYAAQRLGVYNFNGGVTSLAADGSNPSGSDHAFIGSPFASFLLGIPDKTQIDSVIQPNSLGYANSYAFYGQDDWHVSSRLTLNFGLRWEYHPMFQDHLLNSTNFLPNYTSVQNGTYVRGAVVIMNEKAFDILDPAFQESIAPTPILTAAQAGIPQSLRYSVKTDFAPRFGVAWRPFGDDKTVLRGGFGRFIEAPLGSLLGAAYAIHSADQGLFNQAIVNGKATLTFPYPFPANIAQPGSQFFQQAGAIHFIDPVVYQWNVTGEKDLGFDTAIQLSYTGMHGANLGVQGDLNQLPLNTIGYQAAKQYAPYPLWAEMEIETNGGRSNYNSVSIGVLRRFVKGLQFQSTYAFTRNLTNAQSYDPTKFTTEAGGFQTDLNTPNLDYGNVAYTRRHRFLTTGLYQLPFGRGNTFLSNSNGVVDRLVNGWELAGVVMVQSGPFLTATVPGADPSGTGFPLIVGDGRPDRAAGVSFKSANQTIHNWLNPAALVTPQNNIGRFGNDSVGNIPGIGTEVVSASLIKSVRVAEGIRLQIGAQVANLFNHVNLAQPSTSLVTGTYGTVSNVQTAEGAGPRAVQLTGRFTF
jgi:hypothetical protein